MRIFAFFIAFIVQVLPARAQVTPDDIRGFGYAGDVQSLEAAFAEAHEKSLAGDIEFDILRALNDAITTSHPDFFKTTDAWLEAFPESPYANTARAFQYRSAGWSIRGSGPARNKTRDMLALFRNFQQVAADHALLAYRKAPDYVPASDAIFRLQPATKMLPRLGYLGVVSQVMNTMPNLGSLERAAGFAYPGWGGNGLRDISFLCDAYADAIGDPGYDRDICTVHLAYASGWREDEFSQIWAPISDRTHPAIDFAWAVHVTAGEYTRRTAHDTAVIENYLKTTGVTDEIVAERYIMSFDTRSTEGQKIRTDVAEALTAQARAEIEHDPFNKRLIRILLGIPMAVQWNPTGRLQPDQSENDLILRTRLAIADPFSSSSWVALANEIARDVNEDGGAGLPDPYFANAIYYSDHSRYALEQYVFYKLELYKPIIIEQIGGPKNTVPIDVMTREAICPIVRLDRLLNHSCRADGLGESRCPEILQIRPEYRIAVTHAEEDGLCAAEFSASIAHLRYEPEKIEMDVALRPLVFD